MKVFTMVQELRIGLAYNSACDILAYEMVRQRLLERIKAKRDNCTTVRPQNKILSNLSASGHPETENGVPQQICFTRPPTRRLTPIRTHHLL